MKTTRFLLFAFSFLWISCQSVKECQQPPCPQPDINTLIRLTLKFEALQTGEQIEIVSIYKFDQSLRDTTQFELNANREIYIGGVGELGFTEPRTGDVAEEVSLDYKVFYEKEEIHSISNIEIGKNIPECGCAAYQIATLMLDGEVVEMNSDNFILML